MTKHQRHRSFTLIELMVVITIISILTVLSIVSLGSAQKRSRDVQRKTDVLNIQQSLEQFKSANNVYAVAANFATKKPGVSLNDSSRVGDTYVGGLGFCDYIVSADGTRTDGSDPLFVPEPDPTTPGATMGGYLLKYMSRPTALSGSFLDPNGAPGAYSWPACTIVSGDVLINSGRITYKVYDNSYWIRVALENTSEPRVPLDPSGGCSYNQTSSSPSYTSKIEFHDAVVSAYDYSSTVPCSQQLEIYARGNLSASD